MFCSKCRGGNGRVPCTFIKTVRLSPENTKIDITEPCLCILRSTLYHNTGSGSAYNIPTISINGVNLCNFGQNYTTYFFNNINRDVRGLIGGIMTVLSNLNRYMSLSIVLNAGDEIIISYPQLDYSYSIAAADVDFYK